MQETQKLPNFELVSLMPSNPTSKCVYRNSMMKNPTRLPDSIVYVPPDTCGAPPVKVPVVALALWTAAVPVAFSSVVLFIAFEVVMSVAALAVEVRRGFVVTTVPSRVVDFVRAVVAVNGLVVVMRITGSVSDLLVVRRVGLRDVVLSLSVATVCGFVSLCWSRM